MIITIVGCGALGSLLAARLIEGGAQLQVLQRNGAQLMALRDKGIIIRQDRGGATTDWMPARVSDDPQSLRLWLGENGFRIHDEDLAQEGPRYAEVITVVPGQEPHSGEALALGPLLCKRGHVLLVPHLERLRGRLAALAAATEGRQAEKHQACVVRIEEIDRVLAARR